MIASDTRLTDGGYEILTREYMTGRIWESTGATHEEGQGYVLEYNENNENGIVEALVKDDGSITIPEDEASVPDINTIQQNEDGILQLPVTRNVNVFTRNQCPTFIASAGCASDCEALKRQIRSEINAHKHWNYGDATLTPTGIATLLGQTLYSRRTFPFYSFCILAGLEDVDMERDGNENFMGCVHIYDAIGSHERVAVATAGNGREMLQPILDRLFSTTTTTSSSKLRVGRDDDDDTKEKNYQYERRLQRDDRAVHASKQRIDLSLRPPVETYVSCNENEALALLVRGYRSVAEKEISIGDNIVVCILKRHTHGQTKQRLNVKQNLGKDEGSSSTLQVLRFPLKKH
eukprot:CAMPEP_0204616736 /NCGR_PEP_ID=MMETSP0717-20131115/3913_1 /ASSEMBLY_ACC=CAM_ASM_000666 /TAXON_ID=230516 /ORGANISM="Chaetoceros curvisetus" /LENGTH=347 /DNA_ID=CAMNT_0051630069 /DNA_START=1 /DNA_END=1044 /DNA_ORIENTATION=+